MNRIKTFAALLCCLFLLGGCGRTLESIMSSDNAEPVNLSKMPMATETVDGYTFEIPQSWVDEKKTDESGTIYYDPDVDSTGGGVTIKIIDQGREVTKRERKELLVDFSQTFEDDDEMELISTGITQILGLDASECTVNYERPVIGTMQMDISGTFYKSDMITVTYASFPGCHEALRPVYEHVKDTIKDANGDE